MQKILVVDDDRDLCFLLSHFLAGKGYSLSEAYSGRQALEHLEASAPDLVICDLQLGDIDGIDVLSRIKETTTDTPVIIITGHSDKGTSARAMKEGAYGYITKPLLPSEVLETVHAALGNINNSETGRKYIGAVSKVDNVFWDNTDSFRELLKQVNLVAKTNYNVIIYGERGHSLKAVAQEIHKRSKRREKPFIAVDCSALSNKTSASSVFDSGMADEHASYLESANGGTIFLDGVTDLSYEMQTSLINIMQEKKMKKKGAAKDIDVDIRILISTDETLWNAVYNGKFRNDLYRRLNDFNIVIPSLPKQKEEKITAKQAS